MAKFHQIAAIMKNIHHLTPVVAGCALLFIAGSTTAQDWPQWRGPNRDAKVTGFTPPKTWPEQFSQKWKVTVGPADSTPALVGDRLYVFTRQDDTEEVTLCLNAADGREIWRDHVTVQPPNGASAQQHSGPRSSPAVGEGKVVTLGVRGTVSCLSAADGKLLWRKNDIQGWPQFFTGTSPLIVDGLCIVQLGGPTDGAVVAYDLATGSEKWKWTGDAPSYGSPVLMTVGGTKLIVTVTNKKIVALKAADGTSVWDAPFGGGNTAQNNGSPVVDGQTVYYAGTGRGVTAVKIEKSGDTFTAKELWNNKDNSPQYNTPVLKDGFLYGLTQRGNFFCVNAETGKTAWTDTGAARGGGYGSILDAGPVLLALTPASQLLVLQPGDKAFTQVASIKVADQPTYAHPVLSGNRLFVRDKDSLTLWTIQ